MGDPGRAGGSTSASTSGRQTGPTRRCPWPPPRRRNRRRATTAAALRRQPQSKGTRTEWGVRPGGGRVGRSADAPPWGGGPPPSGTDPAGACDGGGATGGGGGPDASGRRGGVPAGRAKGRVVTIFCPLLFSTPPKNLSLAATDTGGSYLLQMRRWWRKRVNGEPGETNHLGHPHPRLGVRRVLGRGLLAAQALRGVGEVQGAHTHTARTSR